MEMSVRFKAIFKKFFLQFNETSWFCHLFVLPNCHEQTRFTVILFMMPYDRELIAQLFKYPVYLLLLFFSYICKFL